ncbi:thioredoxin domain-containing protein 8 [Hippopotamus amphibius kiboko]|uniref:thioredoxin domain-containing protein 8 n=1 Tax=Hippopotamus amphibius kiboko TaxID=575201 RepID=UPI0025963DBE|nr:thioredoxin domain-containing protein 8 [Hippopotamus amphibius kiboko]
MCPPEGQPLLSTWQSSYNTDREARGCQILGLFARRDELKALLKSAGNKLVVIEFSAKWCGPCKRICPLFHAMSAQYRNVMFANVDVDNARELAQTYHIKAIPTFQMFKQAQKVTLFSRIKREICCCRSGFLSEPIFELCGADATKLEEKIRELM